MRNAVVTSGDETRIQQLAAAVIETRLANGEDGSELTVLITSQDTLGSKGLYYPVWLNPATNGREHCFAGFKTVPDSARLKLDLRTL